MVEVEMLFIVIAAVAVNFAGLAGLGWYLRKAVLNNQVALWTQLREVAIGIQRLMSVVLPPPPENLVPFPPGGRDGGGA